MNLRPEQYMEMCQRFPGIENYIIRCELKNELEHLERNEYILDEFEKTRLKFLRDYRRDFQTF